MITLPFIRSVRKPALSVRKTDVRIWLIKITLASIVVYLVGLKLSPFLSPVYLCFGLTVLLFLNKVIFDSRTSFITPVILMYQLFVLVLLVYQSVAFDLNKGFLNEFIRIAFPPTFFIVYYSVVKDLDREKRLDLLVWLIRSSTALLVLELFSRAFLFLRGFGRSGFYGFKDSSPFYPDSNFAGFILLILLGFAMVLRVRFQRRAFRWDMLILFMLIVLSLSRGAIAAAFVVFGFYIWSRSNIIVRGLLLLMGILVAVVLFDRVMADGSFQTKLNILVIFQTWLDVSSVENLWLGIGSGNMKREYGEESHNVFGLTVELGFLWLTFFILKYLAIVTFIGWRMLWVIVPVFITGLIALYPITYTGVLYAGLSLYLLVDHNNP